MRKLRLTIDDFIERSRAMHGDKYDYSQSEYKGNHSLITIICPIHGPFEQEACAHWGGQGCPRCAKEKQKRLRYGVGINDMYKADKKMYKVWDRMLSRCYDFKYQEREPTYEGCSVCEEWHLLSNFAKWFEENYVKGYHLDKDILCKGNQIYSPDTCCFVPQRINNLFIKNKKIRGNLPIGVKYRDGKYEVQIAKGVKSKWIGAYNTQSEAFQAYKNAKEAYIKEVAQEYYGRGEITKKVYDALMRYEVEITD